MTDQRVLHDLVNTGGGSLVLCLGKLTGAIKRRRGHGRVVWQVLLCFCHLCPIASADDMNYRQNFRCPGAERCVSRVQQVKILINLHFLNVSRNVLVILPGEFLIVIDILHRCLERSYLEPLHID